MKAIPYLINKDSSGEPLRVIDPKHTKYQEAWLQELLRNHPDILPAAEIEPVFYPLIPIGREVPISVGYIDNLFISRQGYPVLVETKLWRNPDAKRDVLAQSIEYASSTTDWNFNRLDQITQKYTTQYEETNHGLIEWIEMYTHESLEVDPDYFEDTVNKNFRLGRLLILIIGDRIRSSVVDMLSNINKYPQLAMNIALIELQCFKMREGDEWPIVVVPSILAKTEIVERSIVEVNVSRNGSFEVEVEQKRIIGTKTTERSPLTEDEYWARLKNQNPQAFPVVGNIIEHFRDEDSTSLHPRDNSIAIHMTTPDSGQRISLFFIRTDGVIECWHKTIADQFVKAELDNGLLDSYVQDLTNILHNRTETQSIYDSAENINEGEFIGAVVKFIDSILRAVSDIGS